MASAPATRPGSRAWQPTLKSTAAESPRQDPRRGTMLLSGFTLEIEDLSYIRLHTRAATEWERANHYWSFCAFEPLLSFDDALALLVSSRNGCGGLANYCVGIVRTGIACFSPVSIKVKSIIMKAKARLDLRSSSSIQNQWLRYSTTT